MIFADRKPTKPNRMLITPESGGDPFYATVIRADNPTELGTPLSAYTFNSMLAGLLPAVESADYPGCYYRTVDGETEWINPPLVAGTEYRTAERFDGKPVYVKRISLGQCQSGSAEQSTFKRVDIGIHNSNGVNYEVMFQRIASDYKIMTMHRLSDGNGRVLECYWQETGFVLRSYSDAATSYEAYLTVKYFK